MRKDVNEPSIAAELMVKSGMIQRLASGMYSWLPLGYKILSNIESIISEEFENMGFNRMCIPTLHPAELWKKSERYDAYGKEMLRVHDRKNNEFIYGPSAEEPCVDMVKQANIGAAKLPINLFNIQWKFRDEIRPRFGIIRCREFLMCDGYSFHETLEQSSVFYDKALEAYIKMFERLNLNVIVKEAETGEIGGLKSHEFLIESEVGEEEIVHQGKKIKSLELGHIFLLGDRYTKTMDLSITNKNNEQKHIIMGCYGVGVSRLVAALTEKYHTKSPKGASIHFPENIAPFKVTLINSNINSENCSNIANQIYQTNNKNIFYDDRDISVGQKLASADLIGSPIKIIIWAKELENGLVEVRKHNNQTHEKLFVSIEEAINLSR